MVTLAVPSAQLLERRNVKADDFYEWNKAHVAAKLGVSNLDSGMVSLTFVNEETGEIAAYWHQ